MCERGRRSALPVLVSLVLCAPAAGAPAPAPALEGQALPLALVWSDPQRAVSGPAETVLRREVVAVLSGWGVDARWDSGRVQLGPCTSVLVVALDRERLGANGPLVMGTTHRRTRVEPTVWVLVPNVIRTLESRSRAVPMAAARLGRAIARVLAHEIVHVLAPDLEHAPTGLMRATLGPDELDAPRLALDPASRTTLGDALRACRGPVDRGGDRDGGVSADASHGSTDGQPEPRGAARSSGAGGLR